MRNVEIVNCEPEGSERSVIAIERGETEDGHPTMIAHVIEPGRSAKIGVRSGVTVSLSDSMPKLVAVAEAAEDHAARDVTPVTEDGELMVIPPENEPTIVSDALMSTDGLDGVVNGTAPLVQGALGSVDGVQIVSHAPATEPELDPIDGQSDIVAGEPHTGSIVQ